MIQDQSRLNASQRENPMGLNTKCLPFEAVSQHVQRIQGDAIDQTSRILVVRRVHQEMLVFEFGNKKHP